MSSYYPLALRGLLLSALGLLSFTSARASHVMGGQISYTSLGSNQYRVRIERYVDPVSQASTNLDLVLVCKKNNCTSSAAGSFTVPLTISLVTPATCGGGYQLQRVETTVTLPPAQWQLAIDETNRSAGISNLLNSDTRSTYLSATLDNTRGQADSAPQFTDLELPAVPAQARSTYSFTAFDADGDSLSYQLVPAQFGPVSTSTPSVYACPGDVPYSSYAAGSFLDPVTRQAGSYPAGTYSVGLPLPSFRLVNGVAAPWVELDAATGSLQAAPARLGRYAVAVRVNEYRRFSGGAAVLIGSVTREVTYFVQASTNNNPVLAVSQNGTIVPAGQLLHVLPGQQVRLSFAATDPDANQTLTLSSSVASLLPGASFQPSGATAQFAWTAPTTSASGYYAFSVRAVDSGCPTRGLDTRAVVLHLTTTQPTATAPPRATTALPAYPLPFTHQVTLRLPSPGIQPVLITDALGRAVAHLRTQPDGSLTWQPAHLTAGVYFARTTDGQQVARLVKAD